MKGKIYIPLAIIMIAATVLAFGCAPKEAAPTSQAEEPSIELLWACYRTAGDPRVAVYEHFCDRIKEETNGRVNITMSLAEQIVKGSQEYEAVSSGTIDMCAPVAAYIAGKLPMPAMLMEAGYWEETGDSLVIMSRVGESLSAMFEEDGIKFLGWGAEIAPQCLACNTRLIKVPSDCEGLKIRAAGLAVAVINAWGGTGVPLPNSEVYMALQTGVIDGVFIGSDTMQQLHLYEVAKYYTNLRGGATPTPAVMNLEKWESLPDGIKQIFEEVNDEMIPWSCENSRTVLADIISDLTNNKFEESYTVPDEERSLWANPAQGFFRDLAIKKCGAPAEEFWAEIMSAADECAAAHARGETPSLTK